jgi:methyl-accepting chemotaxis protein
MLALFLPQKIAGPIYRFEQELKKVASGDLTTRFTLRNEDTLQDFAADMSQTIESLRHTVDQAKQSLDALEAALNDNRVEDAKKLAADARRVLARLKTEKDT